MGRKIISVSLSASAAERALIDALDSLFGEPLDRRKIGNVWVITLPALRAQPTYELCVQISTESGATKVMYWQSRPNTGWVGWALWGALGASITYGWKLGWVEFEIFILSVPIILICALLPFVRQDRTRQLLVYAFGSYRGSAV